MDQKNAAHQIRKPVRILIQNMHINTVEWRKSNKSDLDLQLYIFLNTRSEIEESNFTLKILICQELEFY